MAEFPSLPLWTDAYLGDTTHLTCIEHGAYLLLLITAWRASSDGNTLPDDDAMLARFCRLTPGQWLRIRPRLEKFFRIENGRWSNRRLLDEVEAVRRKVHQRSDAGRSSALKRLNRGSTTVQRNGNESSTATATATTTATATKERVLDSDSGVGEERQIITPHDFQSDDGTITITHAEFDALQNQYPAVNNIRGLARNAFRTWLSSPDVLPHHRKQRFLTWLESKNRTNTLRPPRTRAAGVNTTEPDITTMRRDMPLPPSKLFPQGYWPKIGPPECQTADYLAEKEADRQRREQRRRERDQQQQVPHDT